MAIKKSKKSPAASEKAKEKKDRPKISKKSSAAPAEKRIAPAKKAKPIIIDIIEDEDGGVLSSNFFSDASLSAANLDLMDGSQPVSEAEEAAAAEAAPEIEEPEIDSQKKFFSDLVTEIKGKDDSRLPAEVSAVKHGGRKNISLYRHLVWKFLIMVGVLAAIVFYFSFTKLTVYITPQAEAISDTLFLSVGGEDVGSQATSSEAQQKVAGQAEVIPVEIEKSFTSSGENVQGEEVSGTVTLYNNYSKDQFLVATTRLLSSDNKLFRLKSGVNVPAGGQVEASVYADKASEEMAIDPTRFTIPGLWAGLQDKIYAESKKAFSFDNKVEHYVKASDLLDAAKQVEQLALDQAKESRNSDDQTAVMYQVVDGAKTDFNAKSGDKVAEFKLKATAKVAVVSISKEEASRLATAKLNLLVPDDKELSKLNPNDIEYSLENFDSRNNSAIVRVSFSGLMILKDAGAIDKKRLTNLNAEQISAFLKDYSEVGRFELVFYPSFVKKAPQLADRIEIKIKNQ